VSDRIEREREFHDARFGEESGRPSDRFYHINASSDGFFRRIIEALPEGSRLLDYGCGEGAYCGIHAAANGHRVTAIDISPVAIEQAHRRAEEAGVADRIDFQVMNAEELSFPDDDFDAVGGLGVIHHLDIGRAIDNVTRVLKPDGSAFFVEPLGHNPLINLYRNRTPDERSADEHPLLEADLARVGERFEYFEPTYFHLLGLLAIPAIDRSFLDPLVRRLDDWDQALFRRSSRARKYAWIVGMEMSGPRVQPA
jgi:SAM-dependent methyltransferase